LTVTVTGGADIAQVTVTGNTLTFTPVLNLTQDMTLDRSATFMSYDTFYISWNDGSGIFHYIWMTDNLTIRMPSLRL